MHELGLHPSVRERLIALEAATGSFEPDISQRRQWQDAVDGSVNRFMATVGALATYQMPTADLVARFHQEVASARGLEQLVGLVEKSMTAAGILTAGPGHLAYVPGGEIGRAHV